MNVSVLILTRNEEASLPACLKAVEWSDDIIVFDSFSDDRTVEIARASGAHIVQRCFDNERDQRTASLKLDFKYPWVYNPDADEITPPELRDEILRMAADAARPEVAYRVRFKTMFGGKWIRHSSLYPTWVVRLFRPASLSFERSVNLRYIVHGPEGRLQNHFIHEAFTQGLSAWIEKHNRYSTQEARESLESLTAGSFAWRNLFVRSPTLRRRALKELSFRLPSRPALRFLYMYLYRLGFFDGRPGFDYCVLLAFYELMIVLKMRELRAARKKTALESRPYRGRRALTLLSGLLLAIIVAAFAFSRDLLCIESPPHSADVIIVLGGESDPRAQQAAKLFQAHFASSIIVSGDGDADYIARDLEQAGIPSTAIQLESLSRNTMENAEFTSRLLKQRGVHRAIIVTSWFHSRRALNAFCHFSPGVQFSSEPSLENSPSEVEAVHVFQEYFKTAWYSVRYGIFPWRFSRS
jgi:uncharacterized SAM-binding protein YcdF (DUF218 family)